MIAIDKIIAFEQDELPLGETLDLFAELIATGDIRYLQGFYGRTAADYIRAGWITPEGEVTDAGRDAADEADEFDADEVDADLDGYDALDPYDIEYDVP